MHLAFLTSRFPYPLEKGDKLRAYYLIRELSRFHQISLIALSDIPVEDAWIRKVEPYCHSVHVFRLNKLQIGLSLLRNMFSSKPFQVAYFFHPRIEQKIQSLLNQLQPDFIFSHLIRTSEYVRNRREKKLLDYMDSFSKGMERRYQKSPFYLKPLVRAEYQRLIRYESDIFPFFSVKTIISQADQKLIHHPNHNEILVLTNGVDTDYFCPPTGRNPTYDIIFAGNMAYPPNIDSSVFLVKEILPLLKTRFPKIRILLAGANPHRLVKALASEHVTVTGWVEDIRQCYASARILVAPLQMGSGMQNKVLEAMAMQIPCVVTSLVNNAFNATDGRELLIANTAQEFADKITTLLENSSLYQTVAENGYHFILRHYSWKIIGEKINAIITSSRDEMQ